VKQVLCFLQILLLYIPINPYFIFLQILLLYIHTNPPTCLLKNIFNAFYGFKIPSAFNFSINVYKVIGEYTGGLLGGYSNVHPI
jgi:hypothetical protein